MNDQNSSQNNQSVKPVNSGTKTNPPTGSVGTTVNPTTPPKAPTFSSASNSTPTPAVPPASPPASGTPSAPTTPSSSTDSAGSSVPATPTTVANLNTDVTIENTSGTPYTIFQLLELVHQNNASDLHITEGYPPMIRIDGVLNRVGKTDLDPETCKKLVYPILPEDKKELLEVNREVDLAYGYEGVGRFRINAYYQQDSIAAAFRLIPSQIRTIDELYLPKTYHKFSTLEQGLVLITGPTGHGKSTTLAAIIQEINTNRAKHIVTIEDPIEYVFPAGKSLIDQREMHQDTHSWEIALRSVLRQDPDVVLIGEMRDRETISSAITIAETGHLALATLHTNSATQTIDRIIDSFPASQQGQVRSQLADVIQAVVAQRLIPIRGGGRRAVSEVMLTNSAVRNLIREGKTPQLDNVIRTSTDLGMVSLERSLVQLVQEGLITDVQAQQYAVYPDEVQRLMSN